MKFFILIVFTMFLSVPAFAQISSDLGIRAPQHMTIASGDDMMAEDIALDIAVEPDDPDFDSSGTTTPGAMPANGKIDPFDPVAIPTPRPEPRQNVKQVLKKIPSVQVQRSIADDRIDDGYVQGLIRDSFDFNNPIE